MSFFATHCLLFIRSLTIFISVFGTLLSNAQITAPVQASLTLSKPYSLRLSDYVQSGTNRLNASITLLNNTSDPTVDRVQVKLRLIIENNSIRISTPETYQSPNSIALTEGVPELLDGNDLAEYFDPKNLDFIGLDKSQYLQTGRLPEGFYTFRLEVYEYFRGTRLTNQSPSALAWLMLNDPPRWVIPSAFQKITATNPQNFLIQWLPMHTGSPNAVSGVQYDLTMVELWPNTTQNPNDALNTLSPFYTVNDIESTSILIGPDAPQLIPGRTYALRLKARDFSGFDLFKNNGYSEVISFTFGDACLPAESPSAVARNSKEAGVNWLSKSNHSAYRVKYRELGQTVWYTDNATINDWTIRNLNPSKTYEYTIAAQCQTLLSQETEIATFITPAATKADANCDAPTTTTTTTKKAARTVLVPGEQYTSPRTGKVMLVMDNIYKQPNGKFGGVGSSNFGWMPAPFAVDVVDLEVELDGVLMDGKFKTITYGVYVIDAKTYAQAEGTLNFATSLLSGDPPSDANLAKLQDTLGSIRNLPPAAQNLIQQGLAEIKAGKTASGKALVNQGIAQAKTELGRAANKGGNVIGGGSGGNSKDDKIKLDSLTAGNRFVFIKQLVKVQDSLNADMYKYKTDYPIEGKKRDQLIAAFNEEEFKEIDYLEELNSLPVEDDFSGTKVTRVDDYVVVEQEFDRKDVMESDPDMKKMVAQAMKTAEIYELYWGRKNHLVKVIEYANDYSLLDTILATILLQNKDIKDYAATYKSSKANTALDKKIRKLLNHELQNK